MGVRKAVCQAFWHPKRCLSLLLQGAVRIGRPKGAITIGMLYVGGERKWQSELCVLLQQMVPVDASTRFYSWAHSIQT